MSMYVVCCSLGRDGKREASSLRDSDIHALFVHRKGRQVDEACPDSV